MEVCERSNSKVKHLLILISLILLSSPLFGQSSECTRIQIGKMIKLGLSESEILEVCRNPTIKSENKPKPVVEEPKPVVEELQPVVEESKIKPIKYSDKLGIRGNEGNLSTRFLNPPKVTDTRLYVGLGQVIYSIEYNKFEKGDENFISQKNYYNDTDISIGIDSRLFDDNLHYISFKYSTSDTKFNTKSRYDSTENPVYYRQTENDINYKYDFMTLEYIHHMSETFLIGISYHSSNLKKSKKFNEQLYDSDNNSSLASSSSKYESKHDYTYQVVRLQKVIDNLRFDFVYHPEVTSKENYSGDYTGESTTGFGRFLGLNVTKLDYKNDISFGYYKENENTDTYDSENVSYRFGYIFEYDSDLVFKGIISHKKSEGITDSVNPYTSIYIDGTVLFVYDLNTFSINYEYIQNKHEDLGDSSDKYRTDEQFVNIINLGFITNL